MCKQGRDRPCPFRQRKLLIAAALSAKTASNPNFASSRDLKLRGVPTLGPPKSRLTTPKRPVTHRPEVPPEHAASARARRCGPCSQQSLSPEPVSARIQPPARPAPARYTSLVLAPACVAPRERLRLQTPGTSPRAARTRPSASPPVATPPARPRPPRRARPWCWLSASHVPALRLAEPRPLAGPALSQPWPSGSSGHCPAGIPFPLPRPFPTLQIPSQVSGQVRLLGIGPWPFCTSSYALSILANGAVVASPHTRTP